MKKILQVLLIVFYEMLIVNFSFGQWKSNGTLLSLPKGESNQYTIQNTHPHIATLPDGTSYITWLKEYSISEDSVFIYLSAIDEEGNTLPGWPAGGIVVTNKGFPWVPKVIATEDSGAIVAWAGYTISNISTQVYIQKYSKAGKALWNKGIAFTVSGVDGSPDQYPVLISDGHNGCFVTWNRFADTQLFPNSCDVYLQHIDSNGSIAAGWNAAGVAVGNTAGVYEYYPRQVLSADGKYVYVMFTRGPLSNGNLIVSKVRASDGAVMTDHSWTARGITVSLGPNVYSALECEQFIFADKQGNVAAFWLESRSTGNGEYYMQLIDSTGVPKLGTKGKYIAGKTDSENGLMFAEVVQDADGNYLIADNNFDNGGGAGYDIDITKVKYDGTVLWQKISATTNTCSAYPKVVSDGHKGMYVFYKNLSNKNLQALAFDSLGNRYKGWPSLGANFGEINNKDSFNPRYDFTVSATNVDRAVVTWNRIEVNYFNIYACNLNHNGTNCVFDVTAIAEAGDEPDIKIVPNPFADELVISAGSAEGNTGAGHIRIYDIAGKLMIDKQINNRTTEKLNTTQLEAGMYFYMIVDRGVIIKKGKLIKG